MSASSFKYVVLGGGNSSGYAAREFVQRGIGKGELAIITEEPYVAYERPALSKAYLFPEGAARLPGFHATVGGGGEKQTPEWYAEKGIDYKTNTSITAVDVSAKTLTAASGDSISYEKLIVATGARPIYLTDFGTKGADLKNIFYLRNVVDADKIVAAIADAKTKSNKATIVGGGYIGMETAACLSKNGLEVTLVFPEKHLMERLFTPEMAAFYEKVYTDKGIKLLPGSLAASFEGKDGHVTTTVLKNGDKIESDIVLVGVGARPNVEMFKGQLDLLEDRPGGIKVDGNLRTSNPDVYAVGDIAAFPLKKYGITTRQEHVANCRASATHAVASIMDTSTGDYDYLPYFYSRIFDLSWQLYGINENTTATLFGDTSSGKFGTYFVRDGKVMGAFLEGGSPEEQELMKKVAIEQPAAPEDLAAQGIAFASKL
ncbi:monodehydroascorbate reductase [Coccomyxa subellipsoidea C-169]|uniref:monodehydroascorbate reductase (NADH) n=1 Tax=Coccomyxa subellipsoidea (strain C-169) TaxID=574566 RepID=I0YPZ3_COCSC|nr:monodehydroascorbate reductase [Coccomyxa subellipsoidea C-169]EIE20462.1 monodehydroascorbate reductase [Coccomyxa subellipsoidea C-169]|eukprot:XP_005645006.1 monodehydroascorbate reductase [Coccomyxa subellipsoidea C-169]